MIRHPRCGGRLEGSESNGRHRVLQAHHATVGTMDADRSNICGLLNTRLKRIGHATMGAVPTPGQAIIMRRTSSQDIVLCCISNQMKS